MSRMDYLPTEEERLLAMVGAVPADELLTALGISTFRLDGMPGVVAKPLNSTTGFFDLSDVRPATKDETKLHEQAVLDDLMLEAQCGLI